MSLRLGPSRGRTIGAAAALAAGFIAVRVVYRVLFHGATGDGPVVLPLPLWRLPPPFAHVQVLGPATLDGRWSAARSAVPIAATILAFGLRNAVLDRPALIARAAGRGPLQGVARALSVAWATLPALADAVRAARLARRLRGERPGVRLLAPVLERTLERATAVAASLEVRGYGASRANTPASLPSRGEPVVECRDVVATHADTSVRIDGLVLDAGSLVLLTGPTGAGKTTLLRTLSGLHSHLDGGRLHGLLLVAGRDRCATPPRETARSVGVVLQQPREGFVAETVEHEIGLALELRGVAASDRRARVREIAHRVGAEHLLDRSTRALSAGECVLVAIAAAIVDSPVLLLVDEPLADLDAAARERIVELLRGIARDGACVVVAEHRIAEFAAVADVRLRAEDGVVAMGTVAGAVGGAGTAALGASVAAVGVGGAGASAIALVSEPAGTGLLKEPAGRAAGTARTVLTASGITVRRGDRIAVRDAALTLAAGEVVALTGPNGAGKSSLLMRLALGGDGVGVEDAGPRGVALVPDVSDDLFVRDTVAAECRAADRRARTVRAGRGGRGRAGRPEESGHAASSATRPGETDAAASTADRLAALLGLDPGGSEHRTMLTRHPRDLSAGERRCLAIALQTAHRPRVLLVDEPTRGLDPRARALVADALVAQAATGMAVLLATHDAAFVDAVCDRVLPIREGVLGGEADSDRAAHVPEDATSPASVLQRERFASRAQLTGCEPQPTPVAPSDTRADMPTQPRRAPRPRRRGAVRALALVAANVAAAAAFLWPLVASAVPAQAQAAVPYIALSLAPVAAVLVVAALDRSVRSAHTLALLAVLAALGAAIRIASTGVGGVEALFVLLILAGRAYGARFGLLLGAASIALSALVWGGVGPWLPFQMFACGWVGAGAGLLPRRVRGWPEIAMLCAYGVVASYLFGLIMNMWFWPFAVGSETSISYVPGGSIGENLANFLVYSLVTSTAGWDTLRAVTTIVGLTLVGATVLSALRRAKPVTLGA